MKPTDFLKCQCKFQNHLLLKAEYRNFHLLPFFPRTSKLASSMSNIDNIQPIIPYTAID